MMMSEEDAGQTYDGPGPESPTKSEKSDSSSPRSVFETSSPDSDTTATTTSSRSSSGKSTGNPAPAPGPSQWKSLIHALKRKSMRRLATFPPMVLGSSGISKRYLDRRLALLRWEDNDDLSDGYSDTDVRKPSWRSFGAAELAAATNDFSPDNLIGKGGHAEVYKGQLPDGELVAVKRLMKKDDEEERVGDFLSELGIIAHVNHPNAARLVGFGIEGGLHFVLQLSPNGSLASVLHGTNESLDWGTRFKVALGVAKGLLYLHHGCKRRIIHRDIKASNILLGQDYEPQISDFGLAKWLPQQWTHHVVFPIEGTFGYLAPEYFMHGIVDEKTDVFAFGVLLLELITGRRAVDSFRQSLVMWAKPLLDTKNVKELVDPSLRDSYDPIQVKRAMSTASMCINHLATMRPHMNQVMQFLTAEDGSGEVMGREQKPVGVKAILLDAFDVEDYTSSKYLKDLNRYKQLALE